jgi:hypothetical protein
MPRLPPLSDLDAALAALPVEVRLKRPTRSTLNLVSEARRLIRVSRPVRAQLAALTDFNLEALDRLPAIVELAEQAESRLAASKQERSGVSLSQTREEGIALRFRLASATRLLFPFDSKIQKRLEGFHRRRALHAIVGDLLKLADYADCHPEDYAKAPGLPKQPGQEARRIAELLGSGLSEAELSKARQDRNAAAALLAMAVSEVRAGGRYLFRNDPELFERFADRVREEDRRHYTPRTARPASSASRSKRQPRARTSRES